MADEEFVVKAVPVDFQKAIAQIRALGDQYVRQAARIESAAERAVTANETQQQATQALAAAQERATARIVAAQQAAATATIQARQKATARIAEAEERAAASTLSGGRYRTRDERGRITGTTSLAKEKVAARSTLAEETAAAKEALAQERAAARSALAWEQAEIRKEVAAVRSSALQAKATARTAAAEERAAAKKVAADARATASADKAATRQAAAADRLAARQKAAADKAAAAQIAAAKKAAVVAEESSVLNRISGLGQHGLGIAFEALGIALTAQAFAEFIKESAELGRQLDRTSQALGGTIQRTAGLALAFRIADVDITKSALSLGQFAHNISDFQKGTGKAKSAFKELGIAAKDFDGKDLADALVLVGQKMAGISAGTEKAALSMILFGRRGLSLIPLLNLIGTQGFDQFVKRIDKLFSPEAIESASAFGNSIKQVGFEIQGAGLQFAAGFAPKALETLKDLEGGFLDDVSAIRKAGDTLARFLNFIIYGFQALGADLLTIFVAPFLAAKAVLAELIDLLTLQAIPALHKWADESHKGLLDWGRFLISIHKDWYNKTFGAEVAVRPTFDPAALHELEVDREEEEHKAAVQAAENALALVRSRVKLENAYLESSYKQGLIGLTTYYRKRRELQQQENAAELRSIRAQIAAAQALVNRDAQSSLKDIDRRIDEIKAKLALAQKPLEKPAAPGTSIRSKYYETPGPEAVPSAVPGGFVPATRVSTTVAPSGVADREHVAQVQALAETESLTKELGDLAAKRFNAQEQLTKSEAASLKLSELKTKETILGVDAETELVSLDEKQTEDRRQLTKELLTEESTINKTFALRQKQQRAENAELIERRRIQLRQAFLPDAEFGPQATPELEDKVQKMGDAFRQIPEIIAEIEAALVDFGATLDRQLDFAKVVHDAQAALDELDTARGRLQDKVQAGLLSESGAREQILELERGQLQTLTPLADEAERLAAASPLDPELAAKAAELRREVELLNLDLQAEDDVLTKVGVTFRTSFENALTDFFARGITEAKSFGEAIRIMALDVVTQVRQMLSRLLALKIISFLGRLFGPLAKITPAADAGAGGVYSEGGLVRRFSGGGAVAGDAGESEGPAQRLRGRRPRYPGGGRVTGPGGSRADMVPALLSHGEFVVRAAVVKQPGVLHHLGRLNQGFVLPAVRDSRPVIRLAEGGIVSMTGAPTSSSTTASLDASVTVKLGHGLVADQIQTPEGQRAILRVLHENRRAAGSALGG